MPLIEDVRKQADVLLSVLTAHPEIADKRIENALHTAIYTYAKARYPDYHKANLLEAKLGEIIAGGGAQAQIPVKKATPKDKMSADGSGPWAAEEAKGEDMLQEVKENQIRWDAQDENGILAAINQFKKAAKTASAAHSLRQWTISISEMLVAENTRAAWIRGDEAISNILETRKSC